ncbi:MAG: 16S rRNA (adenine(1518)-N(6)/adenine(1519)-N(6))-dimethyltransferase RsmA [Gammaproteobacteria bacterium]
MIHRPRKRFGQHFLHDPAVIEKIVDAIDPRPEDTLIEIGPGTGALTGFLIGRVDRLRAVELDRDLAQALDQRYPELDVIQGDALRFDFQSIADAPGTLRVVGNLPYNISTPLLFHLIGQREAILDMHFMLQKEVVDRMAAQPGSRTYGRLTVMLARYCEVEPLFEIGRGAFNPPPKVTSAFARLVPRRVAEPQVADEQRYEQIVRTAFSKRRKTLRNALAGIVDETQIAAAGLDAQARPGTIPPAGYAALANTSLK